MNIKIITGVVVVIVVVVGVWFFGFNNKLEVVNDSVEVSESTQSNSEFGELAQFFKNDLTEDEKKNLRLIQAETGEYVQESVRNLIRVSENPNGDLGQAFIELNRGLELIKAKILVYVREDKLDEFEDFWLKSNRELESSFTGK